MFANLKKKKLGRFTLRGKTKVDSQWKLFMLVRNIEKIAHTIPAREQGTAEKRAFREHVANYLGVNRRMDLFVLTKARIEFDFQQSVFLQAR